MFLEVLMAIGRITHEWSATLPLFCIWSTACAELVPKDLPATDGSYCHRLLQSGR